uniref:Prominin 1a n=1 Tax=Oncorhynchus mykiss TaxID=8022 RepID=A0A8C7UT70_ONCMY
MWKTGLLLLFWGLLTSGELQQEETEPERRSLPPSGKLDFGYVPQGVYQTLAYYEPGVIGLLFHMVHAFLYVVQPNPFPEDLVIKVAKDKFGAIQSEYQKVSVCLCTHFAIYYETGFVVCAVLGLLFMVLLPLVGLFFCLCRCCDNCGGEMHQRQRKNADCQRGLLTTLLFATSLVITAGVLCAYAANQNLSSQLKGMRRLVSSNLRDLQSFTNETPTQVDYLIAQYATAKNKVISDLDNVGPLLGGKIHEELGKEVCPAMDGALRMAGAMRETKDALENVSMSLEVLQEATGKLHFNLSLVRFSLNRTLNDPGCNDEDSDATTAQLCLSIRSSLAQLHVSANFTRSNHVWYEYSLKVKPNKTNCHIPINDLHLNCLTPVPQNIWLYYSINSPMSLPPSLPGARGMLDIIGTNISSFSKVFPVHSTMANFTNFITPSLLSIVTRHGVLTPGFLYRWICCIGLCCMVVLILAFNFLAILCGTIGYDKHASPTTRGCVSNTGGTLLMAGVGFSFLFSWILMGVVTATFLVGGNLEKLVCEPFHTKQLFKASYDVVTVNVRLSRHCKWSCCIIMIEKLNDGLTSHLCPSNCKENRGIYSAMRLDKVFNVTPFLNSSLVSIHMQCIDLRVIVLLESEGKQNLIGFSETGVNRINYAAYLEEPKGPLQTSLKGHANSLRQIHSQQVVPMEQAMSMLNQSIRLLERTASDLPNKVADVLATIEAAQYLISQNATQVVNQETEKYKQNIVGYFRQYIEWVRTSLTMEVAACKPFSNIVDTVEIVACSFLVDSLNTFWFGLGCCALFLLPSIILSVKLAKFYRRMDTEDVYDEYHKELQKCC